MTKIIVYGTLKRGHGNHILLRNSTFIKEMELIIGGCALKRGYGFPYLYHRAGQKSEPFICELFEVNDPTLNDLDSLEGHPTFYTRTYITELDAWIYIYKHNDVADNETIFNFGRAI